MLSCHKYQHQSSSSDLLSISGQIREPVKCYSPRLQQVEISKYKSGSAERHNKTSPTLNQQLSQSAKISDKQTPLSVGDQSSSHTPKVKTRIRLKVPLSAADRHKHSVKYIRRERSIAKSPSPPGRLRPGGRSSALLPKAKPLAERVLPLVPKSDFSRLPLNQDCPAPRLKKDTARPVTRRVSSAVRIKKDLKPSRPRKAKMTTNGAPAADAGKEPSVSSLIFLGTGTSSQIPAIGCLTSATSRCRVCPSALHPETQKNRRRNTSAFLTLSNNKTILIDCGKSFFDAALQIWPRARLRKIDALLLTHAHADAINGLDDLRGWTLGGFIQPSIDVYLSRATYNAVATTFPYCVDASKATGGGDIPAFRWHIIDEDSTFFIPPCGITVQTLPAEHGMTFDETPSPFICLGFKIGSVAYISDASSIPASTREKLQQDGSGCEIMVLDSLKRGFHPSHMSISQTLSFVNALERPAKKTYLTDLTHETDHYAFEKELSESQKLDIAPAYDGLQIFFEDDGKMREVDLLGERDWVAISEAKGQGHLPSGKGKVDSMV